MPDSNHMFRISFTQRPVFSEVINDLDGITCTTHPFLIKAHIDIKVNATIGADGMFTTVILKSNQQAVSGIFFRIIAMLKAIDLMRGTKRVA